LPGRDDNSPGIFARACYLFRQCPQREPLFGCGSAGRLAGLVDVDMGGAASFGRSASATSGKPDGHETCSCRRVRNQNKTALAGYEPQSLVESVTVLVTCGDLLHWEPLPSTWRN